MAPDIMSTGEVSLLPPPKVGKSLEDRAKTGFGVLGYILFLLLLIFEPQIFGPHVLTKEQEEIGRRQMTVLLPPGALDALKPSPPPAPHEAVRVDPKVLKKVAPPIENPIPAPEPVAPKVEPKKRFAQRAGAATEHTTTATFDEHASAQDGRAGATEIGSATGTDTDKRADLAEAVSFARRVDPRCGKSRKN